MENQKDAFSSSYELISLITVYSFDILWTPGIDNGNIRNQLTVTLGLVLGKLTGLWGRQTCKQIKHKLIQIRNKVLWEYRGESNSSHMA